MGTVSLNTTLSASGASSDPNFTNIGSLQTSVFQDAVTVTSNTLPNGTPVTFKESLGITGLYNINCASPGLEEALYVANGSAGEQLRGQCQYGSFVQTAYFGKGNAQGIKVSVKFQTTVGATMAVAANSTVELVVWDCTSETPGGNCLTWGGLSSASMQNLKTSYHLTPITQNVSYTTASGKTY